MFKPMVLAVSATVLLAASLEAGGPPPMYVVVDKVVLEPNDKTPTRIQIHGSFLRTQNGSAHEFAKPTKGFMYLTAKAGNEAECRKEWFLWQQAAGTGKAVMVGACGGAGDFLKTPIQPIGARCAERPENYSTGQLKIFGTLYYAPENIGEIGQVKELLEFAKKASIPSTAVTSSAHPKK